MSLLATARTRPTTVHSAQDDVEKPSGCPVVTSSAGARFGDGWGRESDCHHRIPHECRFVVLTIPSATLSAAILRPQIRLDAHAMSNLSPIRA